MLELWDAWVTWWPVAGATCVAWCGVRVAKAWGKAGEEPEPTDAEVIKQGWEASEQIARDIFKMNHPDKEDGSPCDCVYCRLRTPELAKVEDPEPVSGPGFTVVDENGKTEPAPSGWPVDITFHRKQIVNLETQLTDLGNGYKEIQHENEVLKASLSAAREEMKRMRKDENQRLIDAGMAEGVQEWGTGETVRAIPVKQSCHLEGHKFREGVDRIGGHWWCQECIDKHKQAKRRVHIIQGVEVSEEEYDQFLRTGIVPAWVNQVRLNTSYIRTGDIT